MARVQYGAMITEMVGSIGGITFQQNRSGAIARRRSGTQKNVTPQQSVKEALFTKWLAEWQGLDAMDQESWNTFALANPKPDRFGTDKNLTGSNWFTSVNILLDTIGESTLSTPPSYAVTPPWEVGTFTATDLGITVQRATPGASATRTTLFFLTPPLKRTTTSFRRYLRLVHFQAEFPATSINLTTQWEDTFGMSYPPSGEAGGFKIGLMAVNVTKATGISSVAVLDIVPNTIAP